MMSLLIQYGTTFEQASSELLDVLQDVEIVFDRLFHRLEKMSHTTNYILNLLLIFFDTLSYMLNFLLLVSEFPNNIRHICTTMPWTIWPSLVVLWGVCWMFAMSPDISDGLAQPLVDIIHMSGLGGEYPYAHLRHYTYWPGPSDGSGWHNDAGTFDHQSDDMNFQNLYTFDFSTPGEDVPLSLFSRYGTTALSDEELLAQPTIVSSPAPVAAESPAEPSQSVQALNPAAPLRTVARSRRRPQRSGQSSAVEQPT